MKLLPRLNDGVYVYLSVPDTDMVPDGYIFIFREAEGVTVVIEEGAAVKSGFECRFRSKWITLGTQTDLSGLGITAAFSKALSDAGISCNTVAAVWHDHIFVPAEYAEEALKILNNLDNN
ncbi:MAG: ACT domain-containing protein [Deferribacteraceae bacterium]|jgi:hypothetical protein|nr:ACT domain-containing protein [Deferribacteraceae bacterium]